MTRVPLFFMLIALAAPFGSDAAGPSAEHVSSYRPLRIWHFVLRQVPLERARWMVDRAAEAGFNAVQVTITDGVQLEHAPWQPRQDAWTKEDLRNWAAYVREKGMKLIPEVKLLTHQEKLFQSKFPRLMYNKSTYDPQQEATYDAVFALLDELIELTKPEAIHIGHDEVAGHNEQSRTHWLRPGEEMLPAELFMKDILRINTYLTARDVEVWVWGDMLLSPEEFPAMTDGPLHGGAAGYGKAVRERLPRSIVICDWHYDDDRGNFPSLVELQREGFRVIATTWKKEKTIRQFSRFAARNRAYGLMATSWFYVQGGNWSVVDNIIHVSGQAFESGISSAQ